MSFIYLFKKQLISLKNKGFYTIILKLYNNVYIEWESGRNE